MLIHVLACVGMPAEITIYLSADHIRAEESSRGIKEAGGRKKIMPAVITRASRTSRFMAAMLSITDASSQQRDVEGKLALGKGR